MTTASKITMARIFMIPFFILAALLDFKGHEYVALAIFIIASATDSLDGYIARHYNQISDFGKFAEIPCEKGKFSFTTDIAKAKSIQFFIPLAQQRANGKDSAAAAQI